MNAMKNNPSEISQQVFRRLAIRALLVPVVALGLVAAALLWQVQRLKNLTESVARSDHLISQAYDIERNFVDLESSQRIFLLTGRAAYYESFQDQLAMMKDKFALLEKLSIQKPEQLKNLAQMRKLASEWQESAQRTIEMPQKGQEAIKNIIEGEQRLQMLDLREATWTFIETEENYRALRSQRADSQLFMFLIGLLFTFLALGATIAIFSWNQLRKLNESYRKALESEATQKRELQELQAKGEHLIESLQKTNERLELALSSAEMATWEFDPERSLFQRSENHDQLFGYERPLEQFQLLTLMNLVHPEDRPGFETKWQQLFKNPAQEDFSYEFRVIWPDKSVHWLSSRAKPVRGQLGQILLLRGAAMNIGRLKEIESELQTAKTLAEEANRAKSAFLANMSHEIRTPLGAILGFSDLLREPNISTQEKKEYLEIIHRNGHQLSRLIDEILDLSKVESGHLEIEATPFSPVQTVSEVMSMFQLNAQRKGISIFFHHDKKVPSEIYSDPLRLKQILMNIVGNAIKFSHHGEVNIDMFLMPIESKSPHRLGIRIRDTGIGIPFQQRDRIFEPFTQADPSMTRKFGGTGLGLVLSRRLARALGGDLVLAATESGEGSTFIITVATDVREARTSLISRPEKPTIPESANDKMLKERRILVVEDSPDNQILIKHILNKRGALVDVANNGKEGVAMAAQKLYDLVIMDIQMPVMDGYEAIHSLRAKGFRKPVIALTAHALKEDREKCFKVGCDEHLTKPIDPNLLVYTVDRLIVPKPDRNTVSAKFSEGDQVRVERTLRIEPKNDVQQLS